MALCHALELQRKCSTLPQYIAIQNSLCGIWTSNIGALIEFAAPLAAIGLAILSRKRPAFQLTLVAIAFMLLAFPVIFFAFTEPKYSHSQCHSRIHSSKLNNSAVEYSPGVSSVI